MEAKVLAAKGKEQVVAVEAPVEEAAVVKGLAAKKEQVAVIEVQRPLVAEKEKEKETIQVGGELIQLRLNSPALSKVQERRLSV